MSHQQVLSHIDGQPFDHLILYITTSRQHESRWQWDPAVQAPDTNEFRAPTVGLEDKIFTISTTADAAKFEVVKEELGKHFATQSWSDGVDAVMVFDTLTEPSYHEPEEPEFPQKMMDGVGDQTSG